MRLRPYRTVEDKIDGVVLSFVEITERRKAEDKLIHIFSNSPLARMNAPVP